MEERARSPRDETALDPSAARSARALIQRATHTYAPIVDSFQPGDLMYGLGGARVPTAKAVKAKLAAMDEVGNEQQAAAVLDELNNVFLGTSTRVTPYGKRKLGYQPSKLVSEQATRFREYLEAHPKYSPTLRTIRGKPLADARRTWERIKKSCKAGLVYTTQLGHMIYFILDELNIADVVRKSRWSDPTDPLPANQRTLKVDPATGDAVGDITGAELRSLYRLRGDESVMSNVTFWRDGNEEPVEAPWVEDPGLWRRYVPKREKKPGFFSKFFRRGR